MKITLRFHFTLILLATLLGQPFALSAQAQFLNWFENKALRIDYTLSGNHESQALFVDELKEEPYWSGSFKSTIDNLNLGAYKVEVFDKESKKLIYSQGFCTLFQEWQNVDEAKVLNHSFEQVTRIPYPKKDIIVRFSHRNRDGQFEEMAKFNVNPGSLAILRHRVKPIKTTQVVANGSHNNKLDIAFIAEGYLPEQMGKFIVDVNKFTNYLFSQEPFSRMKTHINIWAIESPSVDAGPTNPGKQLWNSTAVQSSFYTFGIDRYLTTAKYKQVMDVAANAPADIVYIIVNTDEYGGGGIYNHYNVCTSDHPQALEVFIHELGHGLAGLADEYYESEVAYNDFYNLEVEPWEPNITTLVNFSSKWEEMVIKGTPIPTPNHSKYSKSVGVFEGGGYSAKGIYRPYVNCRMKSNSAPGFCPVCIRAIEQVIVTYSN